MIARDPERARRRGGRPEVISQAGITAGQDYGEGVNLVGFDPDTGTMSVTSLPSRSPRAICPSRPPSRAWTAASCSAPGWPPGSRSIPATSSPWFRSPQAKVNPALGVAVPRFWKFEVTGLFDTGMFQYDNQFVVMSREMAQRFTGLGDAVSGIAVRVADPDRAPQIGDGAREAAGLPLPGPRLADPELEPVQRAAAGKARDGPDYLFHHGRGRVQHRRHAHHGGDRQDPGDRHPAGHGADLARRRPGLPGAGRRDRCGRHRAGPDTRAHGRLRRGQLGLGSDQPRRILHRSPAGPCRVAGRGWWWCWPALRSPCAPRSIPRAPPPRSRRSRRSGTNDAPSSRPRDSARSTAAATATRSRSCPGSISR